MTPSHGPNVDADIERAFLRECLTNYARFTARGVTVADFAVPGVVAALGAASEAWEAHGTVSLENVAAGLQRAGKLAALGGTKGLAEYLVTPAVPDVGRLREMRRLRELRERALAAAQAAERGDLGQAVTLLGEAHTAALESSAMGDVRTFRDLGHEFLRRITGAAAAGKEPTIHPGLDHLYEAVGGLVPGMMLLLIANTNVGKSSAVLEMMLKCSARNVATGLVSVEDSDEVTVRRALSAHSGVPSRVLQDGKFSEYEWGRIARGMQAMDESGSLMFFSDCSGGTELDVMAAMSRMAARGARIVVVDYIGEVEASRSSRDGRRDDIRWVCSRLKVHARRVGVALVVVSQITRPSDKNPNREPTKHDAKESGDLENKTEVMLGMWRESEDDWAPIFVKVLKGKSGGNGLRWQMQRERGTPDRPGSGRLVEIGDGPYGPR
jgi:replicative DNA helicase